MNPFLKQKFPDLGFGEENPLRPPDPPQAGIGLNSSVVGPSVPVDEWDQLSKDSDAYQNKKAMASAIGGAADKLLSAPSAAQILLHQQPQQMGLEQAFGQYASAGGDPLENQKNKMAFLKERKDQIDAQKADELLAKKKDPNSTRSKALRVMAGTRWGVPVTNDMSEYDIEQMIDPKKMTENEAKARIDWDNKKKELAYSAALEAGKNPEKRTFDRLPVENQDQIKGISTKLANQKSIRNSIESALTQLNDKTISDDQKVTIGNQLIKTLNSDQGADAVGAEEAERLAGFLTYHIGNFTDPGPMFGRDLGGFTTQVQNTSKRLADTIDANNREIDNLYGNQRSQQAVAKQGASVTPAQKTKSADATQDPDAVKYAKMYNMPYDHALDIVTKRKATRTVGATGDF